MIFDQDGPQADRLEKWLEGLLLTFEYHIVSVDPRIADTWGRLNAPDRCQCWTACWPLLPSLAAGLS
jgi:hypothetical protein